MNKIGKITILGLLFSMNVAAQESFDSVSTQDNKPTLMERLNQVQEYLDEKARAKVDPNYIEVPKKPWRVVLRYKESVFDVDYSNSLGDPSGGEGFEWKMRFEPPMSPSLGVWAGYRGTGLAVAKSLGKKKGTTLSFSTTGAKYGANLRLRSFDVTEGTFTSTFYDNGKVIPMNGDARLLAPVNITSLYLNGYYVFNGRRYSQAAAYNQSVIQRRSAGSLLLGATLYLAGIDLSDDKNSSLILLSSGVGRIVIHQGNIGIGYGYNFVPFRGLVINAMAMPTISLYNRVKVYKYDCNFDLSPKEETDDYGTFDPETRKWENGKAYKSAFMIKDEDRAYFWEAGEDTDYSMFRLNLDLRLGIAYNWKDYFIGVQAQYNNFHYKEDKNKVNIFDAYARVSFGVRL